MIKRLLFISIALFVFIASGCSLLLASKGEKKEEKLDVQGVLKKSQEEMGKFKGYKWDSKGVQDITVGPTFIKNTFEIPLEFIDERNFHMNVSFRSEEGMSRNINMEEFVVKDQLAYVKDNVTGTWKKANLSLMQQDLFFGNAKPKGILDGMSAEEKEIKMTEQENYYLLEISLNGHDRIKPLVGVFLDMNKNRETQFELLKMTVQIDKKTFQLSKIDLDTKMGGIVKGQKISINQSLKQEFKGEVKEITIPVEVQSIQGTTPGSSNQPSSGGNQSSGGGSLGDMPKVDVPKFNP